MVVEPTILTLEQALYFIDNPSAEENDVLDINLDQKAKEYTNSLLNRTVRSLSEPVPYLCLSNYLKIMQIGQGAYGDVWLAEDRISKTIVALKKFKLNEEREGFPKSSIREISLLKYLDHPNIVRFLGVAHSKPPSIEIQVARSKKSSNDQPENLLPIEDTRLHKLKGYVWVVFEYLPYDLTGVIDQLREQNKLLSIPEIKIIFAGIMNALDYCHSRNVIHRDLKSANLLITHDGVLKVADFGLSRLYNFDMSPMTNRVITLWYRPPELLLGSSTYTQSIDIWSAGCILAELILNKAIFIADKENTVLKAITTCLGIPTDESWPDRKSLPLWNNPEANPILLEETKNNASIDRLFGKPNRNISPTSTLFWNNLTERVGKIGVDLLRKMLCYNPENRLTAKQVLAHPWINEVSSFSKINLKRFNRSNCHAFVIRRDREKTRGANNNQPSNNVQPPNSNNNVRRQCPRILCSTLYLEKLRMLKKSQSIAETQKLETDLQSSETAHPKKQKTSDNLPKSLLESNKPTVISDDGGMMDLEDDDIVEKFVTRPTTPLPPQSPIPLPPQSPPPLPPETPPTIKSSVHVEPSLRRQSVILSPSKNLPQELQKPKNHNVTPKAPKPPSPALSSLDTPNYQTNESSKESHQTNVMVPRTKSHIR